VVDEFTVKVLATGPRVLIESRLPPLSLQARRERIQALKSKLSAAVASATDFHFTHDVEVNFNWFVTEQERYQTHTAADLDNVLKPLLDATAGPDGVMIDDNQVQSIHAWWMTPSSPDLVFTLELASLSPDDRVERDGGAFVEFSSNTSYMLPGRVKAHWPRIVAGYRRLVQERASMRESGVAEDVVHMMSPLARPWRTQRLRMQGFKVVHESEFPSPEE
jgi:Holliday junction resolvase RusA-like endonuclease